MLLLSEALKQKLEDTNRDLRRDVSPAEFQVENPRTVEWSRAPIFGGRVDGAAAESWLGEGTLVGVDGSVNTTSGAHPHTLSVFQALAKGTRGEEKWSAELYTPLLEKRRRGGRGRPGARQRGRSLSGLEIQVALYAIRTWSPRVVMMDGSLLHFLIDHAEGGMSWWRRRNRPVVLLVGVSEEIGTRGWPGRCSPNGRTTPTGIFCSGCEPGRGLCLGRWNARTPGCGKWLSPPEVPSRSASMVC